MKIKFVKTKNHLKLLEAVAFVEQCAPREARGILVKGDPGLGKTEVTLNFGADRQAIYIKGFTGITPSNTKRIMANDIGAAYSTDNVILIDNVVNAMKKMHKVPPIIFDEADKGAENKARPLDFVRFVAGEVGAPFIFTCHTSEEHVFRNAKLTHIRTRLSREIEFLPADFDDVRLFINECCEVKADDKVANLVLKQSNGRPRSIIVAIHSLEGIARDLNKDSLTLDDIKNPASGAIRRLCEDRTSRQG